MLGGALTFSNAQLCMHSMRKLDSTLIHNVQVGGPELLQCHHLRLLFQSVCGIQGHVLIMSMINNISVIKMRSDKKFIDLVKCIARSIV